jgi:hypothetical protein
MSKPGDNNVELYGPEEQINGNSYSDLIRDWTKWLYEQPRDSNAGYDMTGELCLKNQPHANIVFLAGTFGEDAHRKANISSDKSIFFPAINKESSFAEYPNLKEGHELSESAKKGIDFVTTREVRINNIQLYDQALTPYRKYSGVFTLTYPANNIYMVEPGPTQAACEGYFVCLKPLLRGEYKLRFTGEASFPPGSEEELYYKSDRFKTDVEYDITVS